MDENNVKELYDKLINFATIPCEVTQEYCDNCPIGDYCSMLYSLSRGVKGELPMDEVFLKVEADYKNIRWEQDNL